MPFLLKKCLAKKSACGLQEPRSYDENLPYPVRVDRLSGSTVDSYMTADLSQGPASRRPLEVMDESSPSITALQQQVWITSSSLKVANRSFRFASPHLWNHLPVSFRQSTNQSFTHSPHFTHGSSGTSSSFLPSLTPSLFYSRLKTYLLRKSFPP